MSSTIEWLHWPRAVATPSSIAQYPDLRSLPDGYSLRQFETFDAEEYLRLTAEILAEPVSYFYLVRLIPMVIFDTFLVIEHEETKRMVATGVAQFLNDVRNQALSSPVKLLNVGVLPEHRRKGLGLAICGAVVTQLLSHDFSDIRADPERDNAAAIALYRKLGFINSRQRR